MVEQQAAAAGVIASAADADDLAGLVVHRDDRDLHQVVREFHVGFASLDVVDLRLDFRIHRCIDFHRHDGRIHSSQLFRLGDDRVDIALVRRAAVGAALADRAVDQLIFNFDRLGQLGFLFGDVAVPLHQVEHRVAAVGRVIEILKRVVGVRPVDNPGQQRAFAEVQLADVFAEVILGSLLNAADVARAAEIQLVQIQLKNPLFVCLFL